MELKWLGTAGFEFKTQDQIFLVDPYLSRTKAARPRQDLCPSNMIKAAQIFISHGHFDHVLDVPQIAHSAGSKIYCSSRVTKHLTQKNLDPSSIVPIVKDKTTFEFNSYCAQAFFSRHVRFDFRLVLSTLLKINYKLFSVFPLLKNYPCGQVLSWRFMVENKVIQFFGTAGSTARELKQIHDRPIDILLVPLQGHSNICNIGLEYVKILNPKIIIPHHFDDFFPPLSQQVNIEPFIEAVQKKYPDIRVIVPQMNKVMKF